MYNKWDALFHYRVKLNNPLMGTETMSKLDDALSVNEIG